MPPMHLDSFLSFANSADFLIVKYVNGQFAALTLSSLCHFYTSQLIDSVNKPWKNDDIKPKFNLNSIKVEVIN